MDIYSAIFILIVAIVGNGLAVVSGATKKPDLSKFEKLRVNSKNYDKIHNMHKNHYYGALKAIIGQLGKELYRKLPIDEKWRLARCLDRIEDRRDLIESARCVTDSRYRNWEIWLEEVIEDDAIARDGGKRKSEAPAGADWVGGFRVVEEKALRNSVVKTNAPKDAEVSEVGAPREQSFVVDYPVIDHVVEYEVQPRTLPSTWQPEFISFLKRKFKVPDGRQITPAGTVVNDGSTPMSPAVQHRFASKVSNRLDRYGTRDGSRKTVNKGPSKVSHGYSSGYWTPERLNEEIRQIEALVPKEMRTSSRWLERYRFVRRMRRSYSLRVKENAAMEMRTADKLDNIGNRNEKSFVGRLTNLLRQFTGSKQDIAEQKQERDSTWWKTYEKLEEVSKIMDKQKKVPGAKIFERRMYDIVLDRDEPSMTPKERKSPEGLVHTALRMFTAGTEGQSKNGSRNTKTLSPRFMPLMPDKHGPEVKKTLSPTILALYDNGNETDSVASAPQVLGAMGFKERDRKSLISTLMDITGTTKHVENALGLLKELNFFTAEVGDPILAAMERIQGSFKSLQASFKPRQKREIDGKGYTFANKDQIQRLIKDQAAEHHNMDISHFEQYQNMTSKEMQMMLWHTIEDVAHNGTTMQNENHLRKKRQLPTSVLQPIILGPFMFQPVFGIGVLGPLILSPNIFSPPILNPTALGPWVLSPGVADPFILSPYIFGPFILGPFVMTPFILSPYCLSPNVINPYVLSPLILNPICLAPDILTPQVLGGAILSPAVLSPAILTQTFLMATFLSPTFLS